MIYWLYRIFSEMYEIELKKKLFFRERQEYVCMSERKRKRRKKFDFWKGCKKSLNKYKR